ncbi:ABC transporter permease [Spiroplasma tabanidicola]|uniref:ABC transporter permease n=1 Tax=Spiroplasma tabanidicola TaxID=324079 RepID=A0A6I6C9F5_9MOLU|nr:ABC transporter permease [Spiroplasma tabanidicola]QGS52226.1 ABC transporter permease [Spiroplasma tabanidicola]
MKNIFKSYLKLFTKTWVETLGTVLFLAVFTMIVMGMLAIPLQLSLKANGVKNATNTWDSQMQNKFNYNANFLDKVLYKGESYKIKYEDKDIEITEDYSKIDENGWFTKKAHQTIQDYTDNWIRFTESKSENPFTDDEKKDLVLEFESQIISEYAYYSTRSGMNYEYQIQVDPNKAEEQNGETQRREENKLYELDDEGVLSIAFKDIFRPEIHQELEEYNASRNVQGYIANKVLAFISSKESDFRFNMFQKLFTKYNKDGTNFSYQIQGYNSRLSSQIDANLNNLVIDKALKKDLQKVTKDTNEIEAFVNDEFLIQNDLKLGDMFYLNFPIRGNKNAIFNFKIIGIANKYSALTPDNSNILDSSKNYCQIYVDKSFFDSDILYANNFLGENYNLPSNSTMDQDRMIKNSKYDINSYFVSDATKGFTGMINAGTTVFKNMSKFNQIDNLTNLTIMTYIFSVIGGILFVLAFFFITFVLKKEINATRKQLGVFKSLGYKTKDLTWVFAVKTFITMFVAITIGYFLSIPFQIKAATEVYQNIVIFDYQQVYTNPWFLVVLIIGIPFIFSIVSYLVIYRYLNEGALDLMNSGPKQKKYKLLLLFIYIFIPITLIYVGINKLVLKWLKKKGIGFTYRMQETFINFGKGKFILIMILIGFSSFLFTLQMRALPIINNMINGAFNIFTDKTNHYYNYWRQSRLSYRDKIRIDPSSKTPTINYIDYAQYGDVNNYTKSQGLKDFNKYQEISDLFTKISDIRKFILTNNTYKIPDEYKKMMPLVFNTFSLIYPFSEIDNLDNNILEVLNDLININNPNSQADLKTKLKNWIAQDNLYNVKNYEQTKTKVTNAIKLSDVAKYICVSSETEYEDCNNVEAYRQNIYKNYLGGSGNFIENNENENIWNNINENNNEQSEVSNVDKFMSNILKTWLFEFATKNFNATDGTNDQFIASNGILYNSNTDLLALIISGFATDYHDIDIDNTNIVAIDFSNKYGNPKTILNLSGIKENQIEEIKDSSNDYVNVFVSQRIARILKLSVNQNFKLQVGRNGEMVIDAKIAGVLKADNMSQKILIDYNVLMDKLGDKFLPKDELFFNQKYSINPSLEGNFDIKNLQSSQLNIANKLTTTTVLTSFGKGAKEWLGPSLDIYYKNLDELLKYANVPISDSIKDILKIVQNYTKDADPKMVYALNASSTDLTLVVIPILKSAINAIMQEMSNTMLMYILIDIFLLVILLIVIMNIVVTDAINIITIMRSMGYKDRQVNWMVMGRYLTGALVAFLGAYAMSWVVWLVIKYVIWIKLQVLIAMPILYYIPLVSFVAVGGIMFIGWLAAMRQIKKQPLTYLVD